MGEGTPDEIGLRRVVRVGSAVSLQFWLALVARGRVDHAVAALYQGAIGVEGRALAEIVAVLRATDSAISAFRGGSFPGAAPSAVLTPSAPGSGPASCGNTTRWRVLSPPTPPVRKRATR